MRWQRRCHMARNCLFRWFKVAALGAVLTLTAVPAQAQFVCDTHDALVLRLAEAFKKSRSAMAWLETRPSSRFSFRRPVPGPC
ncbi:exported protein of unknown function [Aminobacter niigataensis]|nr:exported protein of unknown function [Aminobacter niigataensis]